jgi:hypothetical protein
MRLAQKSRRMVTVALAAALLGPAPHALAGVATQSPPAETPSTAPVPAPFARVYLAIAGCTSCAHCRASIRQMVRSNAKGGEAKLTADQVEVRYAKPAPVPLRDVIRSLAENRLHDLSLVDVLFEVRGSIATTADGGTRFVLDRTGQAFPLRIDPAIARPAAGKTVRLTALVGGWREKGDLTLWAKGFQSES